MIMAEVQRAPLSSKTLPRLIPGQPDVLHFEPATSFSVQMPSRTTPNNIRNGHLNLDTFSPVNQNGSYEFDRVLKSGYVQKRTRKTKAWKRIYLVLRPNLLSIYKDQNEAKLRHKIYLSELTAVASLKDPKQKRQNVFGLFSPSRNFHLEAQSKEDAEEWIELIRQEARIDEEEEEMLLASPGGHPNGVYQGFEREMQKQSAAKRIQEDRLGTSSPEPSDPVPRRMSKSNTTTNTRRQSTVEYSGNELASHSDMSDAEHPLGLGASTISIPIPEEMSLENKRPLQMARNNSQLSGFNAEVDPERVVWQGYMLYLKSSKGVRQWREVWGVLRQKSFALYKDDKEYSPRLIISLPSMINVVEIDPISKTKVHCLQIITEEKSYRFCAHNEETLDKSLGAFKSLLARQKELAGKRIAGTR